jgi:hypothetical protein
MTTNEHNLKSRFTILLFWTTAITAFSFLTMVELFNRLTLDDLLYANLLKDKSIWHLIMEMYNGWSGRFMAFFFNGIQMKSNTLFHSLIPFSIFLYLVNIFLISKSLNNFFKIDIRRCILFSIIFFQLYVYSMLNISSYFWMCTKFYTFLICLTLFALSDLICNKKESIFNYIILFISFAFLGCSYEIFAPIILLFIGLSLLYKFVTLKYDIKQLFARNHKLVFSFFAGTFFFFIMLIAPGNLVRLALHKADSDLSLIQFLKTSIINSFQLIKLLFLKSYYFFLFIILLFVLIEQNNTRILVHDLENKTIIKRILFLLFIIVGLGFASVLLNTFAIGKRMEMRAFNHINLLLFLFIAFSLIEISKKYSFDKVVHILFPFALLIIISLNVYNVLSNYSELIVSASLYSGPIKIRVFTKN